MFHSIAIVLRKRRVGMSDDINMDACNKFLSRAKRLWLLNPDNPIRFNKAKLTQYIYYHQVYPDLCDFMVTHLRQRYEKMLLDKKITLEGIRNIVDNQPIHRVYWCIIDLVNIWALRLNGPVENLGKIATDKQSIHTISVTKATNDGIFILENQDIPRGQKTLKEIEQAWVEKFGERRVSRVMADMKDWGSREKVMGKNNTYRSVLRGLWAKIKSFSDAELKKELLIRLFEECNESLGMCADGHVGRLVNVLVGFDEQFKNNISPKEYFQNNISLISNSEVPLVFKIDQAKKLMDDIQMPEEERVAWLEAL